VDRPAHPQPAAHAFPGGRRDRHDRAPAVHRAADRDIALGALLWRRLRGEEPTDATLDALTNLLVGSA